MLLRSSWWMTVLATRTAQAARSAGADVVLGFERNRGKGAAVRAGMLAASGRFRVFIDVDLVV